MILQQQALEVRDWRQEQGLLVEAAGRLTRCQYYREEGGPLADSEQYCRPALMLLRYWGGHWRAARDLDPQGEIV